MILSKKFECTTDDLDSVIVSVAKEIENGYHITKIDLHDFHMCYAYNFCRSFCINFCRS